MTYLQAVIENLERVEREQAGSIKQDRKSVV